MSFASRCFVVLYRPISYFNNTKLLLNVLYHKRFIVAENGLEQDTGMCIVLFVFVSLACLFVLFIS